VVKKRLRLVRRSDFQQVLGAQRIFVGSAVVGYGRPRTEPGGDWRIGVAVSRGVRGAVARNRARRRIREASRLSLVRGSSPADPGIRYDVVLIARPRSLSVPFQDLVDQVNMVLKGLRSR
jgi:ribonuclease P protein component